jgi:lysophospholipid acyltransferase (LPLAT)-like uncharacterized protein
VKITRKLIRAPWFQTILCSLIAGYIRLVRWTGLWRLEGEHIPLGLWNEGKPFIVAFWHGRILMLPPFWPRGRTVKMLISRHGDGEIIARVIGKFGLQTVRGSPKKGATQAFIHMIRVLRDGDCVAITPDGPRGPRMRAAKGVVALARKSGAPILPATYSASRRRIIGSWDRFLLPFPFSRGVAIWGEPITVPADADDAELERLRRQVEDALIALTAEADRQCGQETVQPAALPDGGVVGGT